MNANKKTILLLDDDPAILMTVGDLFANAGYEVVKASSAAEGRLQLERIRPDMIVLDIRLPGDSGLSLLKQITNPNGDIRYPVLVFTARAELNQFFVHTGVAGFMSKATDPDRLLAEVARILREHGPEGQPAASARKPIVLVVEDDRDTNARLAQHFTNHGFEVRAASSGLQGVELAAFQRPDAVVLKYNMPHMNGLEVAALLGTMRSTSGVPIVLYDGTGTHWEPMTHHNVRAFVRTAEEGRLLDALQAVVG
jgi:DNA-binding response OmpR family regulator